MLTWQEVFEQHELVGGDLETQEDGKVYRCPISRAKIEDGKLIIESDWCAVMHTPGKWEKWDHNEPVVLEDAFGMAPNDMGNGRFQYTILPMGIGVVFSKEGGSKLDPAKVEGLELATS